MKLPETDPLPPDVEPPVPRPPDPLPEPTGPFPPALPQRPHVITLAGGSKGNKTPTRGFAVSHFLV